jgi:endonuclease I
MTLPQSKGMTTMKMKKILLLSMLFFFAFATTACDFFPTTTLTQSTTATTTLTTTTTTTMPTTSATAPRDVRIEIVNPPTKLVYEFGESLVLEGLQVNVVQSDGNTIPLSIETLNVFGFVPNQAGMQTIIVSYSRFSKTFIVFVKEDPSIGLNISLEVVSPEKTSYLEGETLDLTGMIVSLRGLNQAIVILTPDQYLIGDIDMNEVGTHYLSISVLGLTAYVEIIVEADDSSPITMDYYLSIVGLSGSQLVTQLRLVIQTGIVRTSYGDARYILDETDRDPSNSSNVILIYSGVSAPGVWYCPATNDCNWNREHVWPQSLLGTFSSDLSNTTKDVRSDLHNLKPESAGVNTSRGNKYFDIQTTTVSYNPRNEVRGDIARILFYMVIMYPELSLVNQEPVNFQMALLNRMLEWHVADPVDTFEQNRNNVIFTYQNNRNPFIDYPHLVDMIW